MTWLDTAQYLQFQATARGDINSIHFTRNDNPNNLMTS